MRDDDDQAERKRQALRVAKSGDMEIYLITIAATVALVIGLLAWVKIAPVVPVYRPSPTQSE